MKRNWLLVVSIVRKEKRSSWLVVVTSLLLSIALLSCGYVKRDELDKRLTDQKMETDQKILLAQDAAAEAGDKADKALATARAEIGKAREEAIGAAREEDKKTLADAEGKMKAGDEAVKGVAEKAASKALADAKAVAIAEDEKVKQAAKEAADKGLSAAEEADRKARRAAEEAEVAKTLPKPKEQIVFTVYFDLGQTGLKKASLAELERAADAIKALPNAVVKIEGHTDNVPVVRSQYMNNWGLSQARAQVVTKHLVEKLAVPAEYIKETVGVAFYKPIAPNDARNRHLNRRVEVILMP